MTNDKEIPLDFPFWSLRSKRFLIALMLLSVFTCAVLMRGALGFTIVCMVNSTAYLSENSHANGSKCLGEATHESLGYRGTFLWDPRMQAWLFTATYITILPTILSSGYLADRYGPKYVCLFALLLFVFSTITAPELAKWHYGALMADRSLIGMAEGFTYPAIASLASRWFSPLERTLVAAIYTSGSQFGNIFASFVSSGLCRVSFLSGWPLLYYLYAVIGIITAIIWITFVSNTPEQCRFISEKEKKYLESVAERKDANKTNLRVPWRQMLTSLVTLSIVFCHFALQFQAVIFQSFLPTYFHEVLYLDIGTNGVFIAIIYAAQFIAKNSWALIAGKLKETNVISMTTSCKILESMCGIGTSLSLLGLIFLVDCTTKTLALVLVVIYGVSFSANITGAFTAAFTIAPPFTGIIHSLAGFAGGIAFLLAPTLVGLLNKNGTAKEWNHVFAVIIAINVLSALGFIIFGSAEVQPWAKPTPIEPIASIESNQLKKSQPDEIPIPLRERL